VRIVIRGDFAFIHARTTYTKPDGTQGGGRYTDIWWKRNNRWLCVTAHVTRA
jgi:ketosteroid isomerase-like protein